MKTLNPDPGTSMQEGDLPLSHGFHWEGVSGASPKPNVGLSAQAPDITQTRSGAQSSDTQSASQPHTLSGLLSDSKPFGKGVAVREGHFKNYEKGDFPESSGSGTLKRKETTVSIREKNLKSFFFFFQ